MFDSLLFVFTETFCINRTKTKQEPKRREKKRNKQGGGVTDVFAFIKKSLFRLSNTLKCIADRIPFISFS